MARPNQHKPPMEDKRLWSELEDHPVITKTDSEVKDYIENQITDMADVKRHLLLLTRVVRVLYRFIRWRI